MNAGTQGRILIVEDSEETSLLLADVLRAEGFEPVVRANAAEGEAAFPEVQPAAVLLDWVLPDRPGIEVCRQLRALDPIVPIMFVSGRDDEATVSRGLDAGADDFVFKPIRRVELVARLEAHLRKARALTAPAQPEARAVMHFGEIEIDLSARVARVAGTEVGMGPLEFRVLEYLARNAGIAVSRDQILSEVYGYDADISTERVDLVIRRLRQKLGEGLDRGGLLVAVPGYGYRLEPRPQ
ncbi:MAG TPA: response regulator transcription factor [Candidatus Dormibacteraeota bacterium]|jgi:DNA-binding response OmpR family regulator